MFYNWASDDRVCRYLTWKLHDNIEETKLLLDHWINSYMKKTEYNWAIEIKAINQVIGSISVVHYQEANRSCEIGYCIGYDYWNKGFTTEALYAVIEYLFEETDFHRIEAKHDTQNPASGKVMQKCGLTYEGTLKESVIRKDGSFGSMKVYGILKSDHERNKEELNSLIHYNKE